VFLEMAVKKVCECVCVCQHPDENLFLVNTIKIDFLLSQP